jgi:hypothetical protein
MSTQMANFYNACRKRISNGEKLLDERLGELWDEKINFETLNLGYSATCICGQLKFETDVVDKDRLTFQEETSSMSSWHGFYSGYIPHGVRGLKRTEILQKLWVERIKQRRERRKKLQPFSVMLGSDLSKISEFNTCG